WCATSSALGSTSFSSPPPGRRPRRWPSLKPPTISGNCPLVRWTPPSSPSLPTPSKKPVVPTPISSRTYGGRGRMCGAAGSWTWSWARSDAVTGQEWLGLHRPTPTLGFLRGEAEGEWHDGKGQPSLGRGVSAPEGTRHRNFDSRGTAGQGGGSLRELSPADAQGQVPARSSWFLQVGATLPSRSLPS